MQASDRKALVYTSPVKVSGLHCMYDAAYSKRAGMSRSTAAAAAADIYIKAAVRLYRLEIEQSGLITLPALYGTVRTHTHPHYAICVRAFHSDYYSASRSRQISGFSRCFFFSSFSSSRPFSLEKSAQCAPNA